MENTQKQWTDDQLIAEAESGLRGQGAMVEAMRRLRMSVDGFSRSSDTYSRWMFWLTLGNMRAKRSGNYFQTHALKLLCGSCCLKSDRNSTFV